MAGHLAADSPPLLARQLLSSRKGAGTIVRRLFHNPKELIRAMPRISDSVNRQRRLFALTEPSVDLPAEDQQELRMAMADLLLNAVTRRSRVSVPTRNERSTEDEPKTDR